MGVKRRKWKPGAFVRIDLPDGSHTYGRLRKENVVSVYDARSSTPLEPAEASTRPVLFSVCVAARALATWPEVAFLPLPADLERPESFVKRDLLSGRVTTYTEGNERPAQPGEVETLEVAAVWEPEHIVDRLIDHYARRPNRQVESLRNFVTTGNDRVKPQ